MFEGIIIYCIETDSQSSLHKSINSLPIMYEPPLRVFIINMFKHIFLDNCNSMAVYVTKISSCNSYLQVVPLIDHFPDRFFIQNLRDTHHKSALFHVILFFVLSYASYIHLLTEPLCHAG